MAAAGLFGPLENGYNSTQVSERVKITLSTERKTNSTDQKVISS